MFRFLIVVLFVFGANVFAQMPTFKYNNELFSKTFFDGSKNGDKLIEFIREKDSFERWGELIGIRYQMLPKLNNDPVACAVTLGRLNMAMNKNSMPTIQVNKDKGEAILLFLMFDQSSKIMEFNAWKFIKSDDGNAVISAQFAYRVALSEVGLNELQNNKKAWTQRVVDFDMNDAKKAIAAWEQPRQQ